MSQAPSDSNVQLLGGNLQKGNADPWMFYQIGGRPAFSYGDIMVQPNQKILGDGRAMLWMDGSLLVETEFMVVVLQHVHVHVQVNHVA